MCHQTATTKGIWNENFNYQVKNHNSEIKIQLEFLKPDGNIAQSYTHNSSINQFIKNEDKETRYDLGHSGYSVNIKTTWTDFRPAREKDPAWRAAKKERER